MLKKLVSLCLVLCMLLSLSTLAFASSPNNSIMPPVEAPCGVNGIHKMLNSGWATIRASDGTKRYDFWSAYICSYCKEMLVCDANPDAGTVVGYYISGINVSGLPQTVAWVIYTDSVARFWNSPTLPGYEFFQSTNLK